MNTRQVIEQVASLCALDVSHAKDVLYAALNRALDEIGRAFPKTRQEVIQHALPIPVYASASSVTVKESAPLRIVGDNVASFSLQAFGVGDVTVLVDNLSVGIYSSAIDAPLSLTLKTSELVSSKESARVTLVFQGMPRMHLASVALYATPCEDALPYSDYYGYPASRFSHRFLAFTGRVWKDGRKTTSVRFDDDGVKLPFTANGVYGVEYLALPAHVSEDTADEALDVRADALALVPLLTAYYAALEDDNPAASAFLARYEDIRKTLVSAAPETVDDIYGW